MYAKLYNVRIYNIRILVDAHIAFIPQVVD